MSLFPENTLEIHWPNEGAIGRFSTMVRQWLKEARLRRKSFHQTVHELSYCSDRDLSDLGIARCDIRRLAREAAELKVREARGS